MQIGAVLPHHEIGDDPGAIRDYISGLEGLGLTHLLVYDHVLGADRNRPGGFRGPYDKDVAFHEPLTFLSFVAAMTTTLELVSTVLIAPQRQTALIAKQAAEVAVLSGGRLRLGLGIGWNEVEYEALGVPFLRRGARLDEQVDLLRRLWVDDVVTFHGDFHTVELAGINPRPPRTIPIWFGGGSQAALRRCALAGQGWMPLAGAGDKTRVAVDLIRESRDAAGLSMADFGIQAQAQFAGGDPELWRKAHDRWDAIGATHLAFATHKADVTDADGHLRRLAACLEAVDGKR